MAIPYNCPYCSTQLLLHSPPGAMNACSQCGQTFVTPVIPAMHAAHQHAPAYHASIHHASRTSGMAVASMVLGIIAVALFCFWPIAIPCGLIALILGCAGMGEARRPGVEGYGMAVAGVVCGTVSIGLYVGLILIAGLSIAL